MREVAKAVGLPKKKDEAVRVFVRVRPLSKKEKGNCNKKIVFCDKKGGSVEVVNEDLGSTKMFTFDGAFEQDTTQKEVYDSAAASIVESVLKGYNGTIFCYGQTGAGKTHTMEGYSNPPNLRGIIPNAFVHIFDAIKDADDDTTHCVYASYLEIYNESIRDLLAKHPVNSLELKEGVDSGVYVDGLTKRVVRSVPEIDEVQKNGKKNRSTGATAMNQTSSRSHSIFTIVVESSDVGPDGKLRMRAGKLNLVDLAGSERQSKTRAEGDRLKEAININKSLSALGNVISSLVDAKSQHIPYRDSKLTRLLEDSLGGNTKTVMIANCGPADYNFDETLSTLRYADRAKQIKNKPKINEDPKDAMLRGMMEEAERLQRELSAVGAGEEGDFGSKKGGARRQHAAGISESEIEKLEKEAARRKRELRDQAEAAMREAKEREDLSRAEREVMMKRLQKEQKDKRDDSERLTRLAERMKKMKEKVIFHDKIKDKRERQRRKLRLTNMKLQERELQERRLQQELKSREQSNILMEQKYSSLDEEVEEKTKKLKKLISKYQQMKGEVKESRVRNQKEREQLWLMRRTLEREIKLKQMIVDHFVPKKEAALFDPSLANPKIVWDDDSDTWRATSGACTPQSLFPRRPRAYDGSRRVTTDSSRQRARRDKSSRFRTENLVDIPLYSLERTTRKYEPDESDRIQEALDLALAGEADEEVSASPDSLARMGGYRGRGSGLSFAGDESYRRKR